MPLPRLTIAELHACAARLGGKLVSTSYRNSHQRLEWTCAQGHSFFANANNVRTGKWCPYCKGKLLWAPGKSESDARLEECQSIAASHHGVCVSQSYINRKQQMQWRCELDHEFTMTSADVCAGYWCPYCAGRRIWSPGTPEKAARLNECQSIAIAKRGECLSTDYRRNDRSLRWRCEVGHEWKATPGSVKGGSWCPYCAGRRLYSPGRTQAELRLEELRKIAIDRGGTLLSNTYSNNLSPLRWKCAEGHEWEGAGGTIKAGHWCPQCSGSLGEELCRSLLEKLTGEAWPRAKPRWLVSPRGGRMEMDGYCTKLQVGFEYHGRQHYDRTYFHPSAAGLELRQADDAHKRQLCEAHGIQLIEVPYSVPSDDLPAFLVANLSMVLEVEVHLPADLSIHAMGYDRGLLGGLQEMATLQGGRLLSSTYLGVMRKHLWECANGHSWEAIPASIKKGSWCPTCSRQRVAELQRGTLEECIAFAQTKGGQCLAQEYVSSDAKMLWKCAEGHQWMASFKKIKHRTWCPYCAGVRIWLGGLSPKDAGFAECQQIAAIHKGRLLSPAYINANTPLSWECAEYHQWYSRPAAVKRGAWCPKCRRHYQDQLSRSPNK